MRHSTSYLWDREERFSWFWKPQTLLKPVWWTLPTVLNPFEQVEVRISHTFNYPSWMEARRSCDRCPKIFSSNTGLRLQYLSLYWSSLASLILAEFEREEQYWMFTRPLRQIYWIPACLKGKFLRNKLQILYDFRDKYIALKL